MPQTARRQRLAPEATIRLAVALFLPLWLATPLWIATPLGVAAADAAEPPPDPMTAVRADRWADAAVAASHYADPVAGKVVTYYRLLAPGAATAQEIAAFVATSPDWPAQALLERRRQEAIASDPDDAAVLAQCGQGGGAGANATAIAGTNVSQITGTNASQITGTPSGQTAGTSNGQIADPIIGTVPGPITLPAARLRCANALANAGLDAAAAAEARRAWTAGFANDDAAFPQRWRAVLTPADQWDRFQTLAWSDPADAARQLPLLDPAHRAVAQARLALQRDDPAAAALLAAVPHALANDPSNFAGLMLDQARWLRRSERIPDAVTLWRAHGAAAQQAAPASQLPAFWAERERLARRLLHDGNAADAYALVDDPGPIAARSALDAAFLAGFIALRLLHQPAEAARHFRTLTAASPAAITQGRAWYWLGRAAAANTAGQDRSAGVATGQDQGAGVAAGGNKRADDATAAWAKAAAWPTTFYGQLAALALGDDATALAARVDALRDPPGTRAQAFGLTQREVVRAAALLVAWGEPRRAEAFLLRMDELAPDLADRALTARLATFLGQPQTAVAIARRMGRDGFMLPQAGWTQPVEPPQDGPPQDAVDPAVVLGLIRQESSFDSMTVSPAGARGLMQLMPGTAATLARQIGTTVTPVALVFDPRENMRLGTEYLRELLGRYAGTLPLALAAYNAGPGRVDQWLTENGDPRVGAGATSPGGATGSSNVVSTGGAAEGSNRGSNVGLTGGAPWGSPGGSHVGSTGGTTGSSTGGAPAGLIDMIDWIELIPFGETRDYVQRVLENVVIYRARRGEATPTLLVQWTR
jgi:soluble lytic murein transglycosylase